jgi:hypothetical protein
MFLYGLALWLMASPLLADTHLSTQIHDIDFGKQMNEDILVFLKSGHVAKIPRNNPELLQQMTEAKDSNASFDFKLDSKRNIVGMKQIDRIESTDPDQLMSIMSEKDIYIPTTIASTAIAQKYFREAPYNPKESQCFNRAMVWTYGWWKAHSLRSNKILIFFSRNYIRTYDFEWWFHISPYVHIMQEDGKVVERVMDVKYTRGPLEFRNWTNIFMRNRAECPAITKFSEYADSPYTGDCFIIRTNMYTYQPADLQMIEAWGYQKSSFIIDEVKAAYLEAFDIIL